jgi:hypothetical protein
MKTSEALARACSKHNARSNAAFVLPVNEGMRSNRSSIDARFDTSASTTKDSDFVLTNWLHTKFVVSTGLLLGEDVVLCAPREIIASRRTQRRFLAAGFFYEN